MKLFGVNTQHNKMIDSLLPKNKPCPKCGRYNNRPIAIDAVIVKNEKLVLIKRGADPFKGYWGLPGGHVDWDETIEDAVIREVKEEVGVTVTHLKLLGVYSSPTRSPKQSVALAYVCEVEGELKAGDDAVDVGLYPFDSLPSPLAFDHGWIIENFNKHKITE